MPVPYSNIGMKFCKHCKKSSSNGECIYKLFGCYCPILPEKYEFIEAAEFEARVARNISKNVFTDIVRPILDGELDLDKLMPAYLLKKARLAVEEELDG